MTGENLRGHSLTKATLQVSSASYASFPALAAAVIKASSRTCAPTHLWTGNLRRTLLLSNVLQPLTDLEHDSRSWKTCVSQLPQPEEAASMKLSCEPLQAC